MRLVFLGSPPFATPVLARVLESRHAVLAVATRPEKPLGRGLEVRPSPVAELASSRGVPVLRPSTARDPAFVAQLKNLAPDALLVASYGEILGAELIDLAPRGPLNVHASLLPRHRGASPIQAAILAGDRESGVTIQRMVLALDEGDLLLAERTPIEERETAGDLLARLALLGGKVAVRALDLVESGRACFVPQDPALATYARRIRKEQGRVDWSRSAAEIARHVRAMTPWPGARAVAPGGKDLVLLEVREVELGEAQRQAQAPGSLLASQAGPVIATGAGAIEILSLKPSGGVRMDGAAWLRGARLPPDARLGS